MQELIWIIFRREIPGAPWSSCSPVELQNYSAEIKGSLGVWRKTPGPCQELYRKLPKSNGGNPGVSEFGNAGIARCGHWPLAADLYKWLS